MKAGLISLLALCQFMALIMPSCAGGEMLTIGKYDISFYLNSSDPYSIDAGEEDGSCQAIINDSRHKAVIYIEEAECIGFKDALAIVDQLLAEAEIDQPDHYQMFIDGHRAVLGMGSLSAQADGGLLYTAAYPMYFGAGATGIYVLVGSNFSWDSTMSLLDSLNVELNRSAEREAQIMPALPCRMPSPCDSPVPEEGLAPVRNASEEQYAEGSSFGAPTTSAVPNATGAVH